MHVRMSKRNMRNCNSKCYESKIEDFAILKNQTIPLGPVLLTTFLFFLKDLSHTVEDSPLSARSHRSNTSRSPTFDLIVLLSTTILVRYLFVTPLFNLISNIGISDKKTFEVTDNIIIDFIDILRLYFQLHFLSLS